jgi:hypothetical protein
MTCAQQKRLAESSKEHARLQSLKAEQEQERAMALEGHAEALSADIERLCTKLEVPNNLAKRICTCMKFGLLAPPYDSSWKLPMQVTQKESAEAASKMSLEVERLQHRLAILQSEKDLCEERVKEQHHLASVNVKAELNAARKTIEDQVRLATCSSNACTLCDTIFTTT